MSCFLTKGHGKRSVVELAKQLVPSLLEACNGDIVSAVRVERSSMLCFSKLPQDSWADSYHRYKSTMLLLAEHDARIPTSYVPPDVRRLWHAHILSPVAYDNDMQKVFGKKLCPLHPRSRWILIRERKNNPTGP